MMVLGCGLIVWKMTGLVDSIVSWCKYIALPIYVNKLNWSEGLRCSDCYNVVGSINIHIIVCFEQQYP